MALPISADALKLSLMMSGKSFLRRTSPEAKWHPCTRAESAVCKPVRIHRNTPSATFFSLLTAGLLAHEYVLFICLPTISRSGPALPRREDERQSAYSCGGSLGLGPFRVFRTVFPINPLEVIRWGNRPPNE